MMCFLILFIVVCKSYSYDTKIFNGRLVKEFEFPFTVRIMGEYFGCGGAIVTSLKIVTAGHCFVTGFDGKGGVVYEKIDDILVIAGAINISDTHGSYQDSRVKRVLLHEKYEQRIGINIAVNDIAVAELVKPFKFCKAIQPMKLVSADIKIFKQAWDSLVASGKTCFMTGWGGTRYEYEGPERYSISTQNLKVIEVRPWNPERCSAFFDTHYEDIKLGEVCISSIEHGAGTCQGDSGGSLLCEGHNYGLDSFGYTCGNESLPTVFLLYQNYIDYFALAGAPSIVLGPFLVILVQITAGIGISFTLASDFMLYNKLN